MGGAVAVEQSSPRLEAGEGPRFGYFQAISADCGVSVRICFRRGGAAESCCTGGSAYGDGWVVVEDCRDQD